MRLYSEPFPDEPDPPVGPDARPLAAVALHPSTLAKLLAEDAPRLPVARTGIARFAIRGQTRSGVTRLQLSGSLDQTCDSLVQVWLAQAEQASNGLILVDLQALMYIDKAGFAIFLRAREHARLRGLRLVLTNCRPETQHFLEAVGTQKMFREFADVGADGTVRQDETGWSSMLIPAGAQS